MSTYTLQQITQEVARLIAASIVTVTLEEFEHKLSQFNQGDLDRHVAAANSEGITLIEAAYQFLMELA